MLPWRIPLDDEQKKEEEEKFAFEKHFPCSFKLRCRV